MTTILTKEDKISIINQHKRTAEYNKYGIELSILQENAVSNPNENILESLNSQLADFNDRLAVLDAELAALQ